MTNLHVITVWPATNHEQHKTIFWLSTFVIHVQILGSIPLKTTRSGVI